MRTPDSRRARFLDRVERIPAMNADCLRAEHLEVVLAVEPPFCDLLILALLGAGIERITLATTDPPSAARAAERASAHAPWAHIELQHAGAWQPSAGRLSRERILIVDLGVPLFMQLAQRTSRSIALWVARKRSSVDFGTEMGEVGRGVQGPLEPRAELWTLAGELLNAICAAQDAWVHPDYGFGLAGAPRVASLPAPPLPPPEAIPSSPLKVLMAGGGGAIATQLLVAALGLDPILRQVFSPANPESLIRIVDGGIVEESNRARQLLYDRTSVAKASEIVTRCAEVLDSDARLEAVDADLAPEHFAGGFDIAVSSLDSWGERGRRLLGRLCDEANVPWILQTGSDPLGGTQRLVGSSFGPCMEHGPERLSVRPEESQSCAEGGETVLPSSVVPQCIVGGTAAAALRDHFVLDRPVSPRGVDVRLTARGSDNLVFGPGEAAPAPCGCRSFVGDPAVAS